MISHEGRDPFVCGKLSEKGQECGAGFDTEGKLNSHIGRIHGTKRFVCTMCSPTHVVNDPALSEEYREASFPSHAALQAHLASEHPPTCAQCGLQCTSQSALKSHVEVIHGGFGIDERRTHICQEPDCGRGFTKKGNLNAHVQISHTGKQFVCGEVDPNVLNNIGDWNGSDACGEALKSKANLEKHIRGVHLGLEPSGKAKKKGRRSLAGRLGLTHQASTLTKLTGYGTDGKRVIFCLVQGCNHRFIRDYDLEIHLQSQHGLADFEIQDMLKPEPQGFSDTTAEHVIEARDNFTLQQGDDGETDGIKETNETEIPHGADSWLGAYSSLGGTSGDTFSYDGMDIQDLSHGNYAIDGGDVDMIDPNLL